MKNKNKNSFAQKTKIKLNFRLILNNFLLMIFFKKYDTMNLKIKKNVNEK